jgi:pyruvate/2-oxoglutarate dehydrogenase complex dihydrolipoamide dehydrogenase (E3) component
MAGKLLTPDICVIGAGAGGLAVAYAAAAFGVHVVLIEQTKMGGENLAYGSVPSKALLAAARRLADIKNASPFGIAQADAAIDFAGVRAHIAGAIAAIAPNVSASRFAGLGVQVIAGTAQFIDRTTVAVGDDVQVKARRFVIATGSSPATPLIPGLDGVSFFTDETIFGLTECPQHLIVIGAGSIGLELAQAFRRLGAAVTVIEARAPLGSNDAECVDVVLAALLREGIAIHANASIKNIARAASGIDVVIETAGAEKNLTGSHLLLAAGRRPNTDALNLKAAGIKVNAGGILVNRRLHTSNKKVYAIGDVAGGPRSEHAASYHAGLVVRNALFRQRPKVNDSIIPKVTFTDPELAQVGLTEAAARQKKYRHFRVLRAPLRDNDRAQVERETRGHIKIITTREGGILGATIVGRGAGELIAPWTLAVAHGLNIRSMAELVMPYPTLSEISKRAAAGYFAPDALNVRVRRLIAWLRRWG